MKWFPEIDRAGGIADGFCLVTLFHNHYRKQLNFRMGNNTRRGLNDRIRE